MTFTFLQESKSNMLPSSQRHKGQSESLVPGIQALSFQNSTSWNDVFLSISCAHMVLRQVQNDVIFRVLLC